MADLESTGVASRFVGGLHPNGVDMRPAHQTMLLSWRWMQVKAYLYLLEARNCVLYGVESWFHIAPAAAVAVSADRGEAGVGIGIGMSIDMHDIAAWACSR